MNNNVKIVIDAGHPSFDKPNVNRTSCSKLIYKL